MISTAADLIDALGGNRPVGERLGVRENTVSTWRVRGFPAWARDELRDIADEANVQYDRVVFGVRRRVARAA